MMFTKGQRVKLIDSPFTGTVIEDSNTQIRMTEIKMDHNPNPHFYLTENLELLREKALSANKAVARLKDSYELIFVSYDDQLTDEQIDSFVSGDTVTLFDSLADFEMESIDNGVDIITDETFTKEEWDSLSEESQETIKETIAYRDNSDWFRQLINQTPNPLLRINCIDQDNAWSFKPVTPFDVLTKIGFESNEHNIKQIQTVLDESSPEYSVLLGYWIVSIELSQLDSSDDQQIEITNPYLYLGNPFSGSGYISDKSLHGSVIVNRSDLHTDKQAFGYSVNEIFGGLNPKDFQVKIETI